MAQKIRHTKLCSECRNTVRDFSSRKLRNKMVKIVHGNGEERKDKCSLNIMQWNIGSRHWQRKRDQVQAMADERSPDIFTITEANLFNGTPDIQSDILGYKMVKPLTYLNPNLEYSRVLLFVKNNLNFEIMRKHMDLWTTTIWIKITKRGQNKLIIGAIYREHTLLGQADGKKSSDIDRQISRWRQILKQWNEATKECDAFVIGDINLDYVTWNSLDQNIRVMVEDTKNCIETAVFQQIVKGITRSWNGAKDSLLDQVWTNAPHRIISTFNLVRGAADHNISGAVIRVKGTIKSNSEFVVRNWRKLDQDKLIRRLGEINWDILYSEENVHVAANFLENSIKQTLDEQIPLKKIQPKTNYKCWLSTNTKEMMKKRDTLKEAARISGDQGDWTEYKATRNKVTKAVTTDRKKHYNMMYKKAEEDKTNSELYKTMKNQMGQEAGSQPVIFRTDGRTTTTPAGLAEEQMNYYHRKNTKLLEQVENSTEDPLETLRLAIEKWDSIGKDRRNFEIKEITLLETAKIIKTLGDSKARGHDNIEGITIKLAAAVLLKPINYVVNLSIRTLEFPAHWKIGKILPLFKGKGLDRQNPASYRPVQLLPSIGKIMERVVQQQMVKFMDETEQWHGNMHAYRKKHSTCTALLQLSDDIFQAADEREVATAIMVDESSAFDCINFETLDGKLELYGFGWKARKWIKNYLTNRSQYTEISGKTSAMKKIERGVPQGSVIGPTIFSIYINEMPEVPKDKINCKDTSHFSTEKLFTKNCTKCGQLVCFADDATYDRNCNQENITKNMEKIKGYLNANDLAINDSKTAILEIMNKQKRCKINGNKPFLNAKDEDLNDVTLVPADNVRLLGVNLSKDLSWVAHLETGKEKNLLPALRKQLGRLKYLAPELSKASRKIIAQGTIISRILYAIPVWGGLTAIYSRKLQVLQNNVARVITGLGKRTSMSTLMREMNWLSIKEMIEMQTTIMVWKVVRTGKPEYLAEKMKLVDNNSLRTETMRLKTTADSFRHRGIRHWNALDDSLRECKSLPIFRKNVRKTIIERRGML